MKSNDTIRRTILAILGTTSATAAFMPRATAAEAAGNAGLEEIVVTATKRAESLQNVPIAVTALTSETIQQLNVTNFNDYAKFIPNVAATEQMPGVGQIYIRGLGTTQDGVQSSGATGSFPNVAVYLDEQSAQLPGRNLDIYAADLERIEVLEGPQGTLFGAGAQAGVVRYITNKPKLNRIEANVNGSFGFTTHGDPSSAADFTFNLPVIPDKFALRAVLYSESRGGYIDNVPGSFTRRNSDVFFQLYGWPGVPAGSPSADNSGIAQNHFNPVTYRGMRLSGLLKFNDDWDAQLTESYQHMHAEGVFAQAAASPDDVPLPELSVVQFTPSFEDDKFTNTALTVNGRFGDFKFVYTGGYMLRKIHQVADYTNYDRGAYADYYQCPSTGFPNYTSTGACGSPVSTFKVVEDNTHLSHEVRLSTPDDWRLRAIGGLFYEDFKIGDSTDWYYGSPLTKFGQVQPPPGATAFDPSLRPVGDAFVDDITRGYKQKAAFASVDFDLVPKTLTLTAGTRYFDEDTYERGSKLSSYGCQGIYPAVCTSGAVNLDTLRIAPSLAAYGIDPNTPNNVLFPRYIDSAVGLHKTYKGFRNRFNLTWKITPDAMVYATVSQGFRPGGFNRGSGFVGQNSPLKALGWYPPAGFSSDSLTNVELGWKTQWLDHRLQINGAVYDEKWKDVQIGLFDPGVTGNLTFTTNGPEYEVKGGEFEIVARPIQPLTLALSGSINDSKLSKEVNFVTASGQPVNWSIIPDPVHPGQFLSNPFGTKGTPLALAPKQQFSGRVRYEFPLASYQAYWQLAGTYRSDSYASTDRLAKDRFGRSIGYLLPSFAQFDTAFGFGKDAWNVELYCANCTDKRGVVFSSYSQFIKLDTITRPRTLSLRLSYKFSAAP